MVWEKYNPYANRDFPNFIEKMIVCDPLKGDYYESDCHTVHQTMVSFTKRQPSEDWLKDTLRYSSGRISMKLLRNYLAGEVNTTIKISKAEQLRESLHYKN